jgi:hypothetical protein
MWALDFLPDIVFHSIFAVGCLGLVASFVLGFLPFIAVYKNSIQIISICLFSLGLWYEGGIAKDKEWKAKVAALEVEIAKKYASSARADTEIVTKIITKKQVIKEKGDTIIEYIDREIVKFDSTCPIPEKLISAHNAAASNNLNLLSSESEVGTSDHNKLAVKTKIATKK